MASYVLLCSRNTVLNCDNSTKAATIWLDAPYDEEHVLNALFERIPLE